MLLYTYHQEECNKNVANRLKIENRIEVTSFTFFLAREFVMPKCTICGKKFGSLTALQDHHRAMHPGKRFAVPKSSPMRMMTTILVIVIIAVSGGVGYLIYTQQNATTLTNSGILNTPISSTLYDNIGGVSFQTLSAVGVPQSVTTPTTINPPGQGLAQGGKPQILYIGAEFCPYCAAERWGMVVALSKFGNFSNLEYMQSADNDVVANGLSTLSFRNSNYASQYITFVSVENEDRNHSPLQAVTSAQQQIWSTYTSNRDSYPFIYFSNSSGGVYYVSGAQYAVTDIQNLNWTQIGSQLSNPNSNVAKVIDGTANTFINAICKLDGGKPSSVCGQSYLQNLSYSTTQHLPGSLLALSETNRGTIPDSVIN